MHPLSYSLHPFNYWHNYQHVISTTFAIMTLHLLWYDGSVMARRRGLASRHVAHLVDNAKHHGVGAAAARTAEESIGVEKGVASCVVGLRLMVDDALQARQQRA
jgi:hypothetical protein